MAHSTSDIISSFENEQKNTVFSALSEYLSTGHFVDISLVCKGQILRAHKVVLSSSSKYFKDFFRHQPGVNIIDLDKELAPNDLSLTLEDVQLIIGILYCVGTVEISPQRIETLLICAQVLGIPTLISFLKKIRETLGDGGSKMIKEQPRTGIEYLDQCSRAGTSLLPTNILSPVRTSHKAVVPSVKSHNFPTPSRGVQQLPSRTGGVETPGQRESTEMMYLLPSPSGGTQGLGNFQGNHLGPSVLPPVGTRIAAPVHPRISATSGIGGSSRYTVGERRPSSSHIDLSVVKPLTASCINTPVPQEEQSMEKGLPSEQLLLRGRLRTEVSSTPSEKKQPLLGSSSSACHVQNPELAPEHSAGSSRRVQDSLLSCHKIDPDTVRGSMNLPRDTSASRISSASFSSFSGLGYLHSPRLKSAELPSGDAHTTGSLDGFDQNFLLTLSSLQANQIDDLENVLLPHLSMDVPRSESTLNNQLLDLHHMDEVEDNDISTTTPEGGATPCSVEGTVPTPCFNDHNHLEDNIPTSDDEDYSENDDDDSNNDVDHSVVANNQNLEDASHYSSMANQHTISNADNSIPNIGSNDNQKETTIMVKKVKSSSISDGNIFGNRKKYNDNNIMGESNELTVPQDGIKASELSLSPISETVSRSHISVNCDEVYNGNQETRRVTRNMFNQEATPTRVSENVKLVDNQDDICSSSILSIKFIDKEKVYMKKDNNLRETNIEENLHHVQAKYNQNLIGAKRSLLTVQSQQIDAEYPSALLVSPSCPESPPQPVSTFRTVSTPQPVFTPQQLLPPQPVSSPHQEFSSQPSSTQLLSNPHPVVSPEQVSTPRTISTPRQVSTPRLVSSPRPISTPRPVSSPRLVLTPRPVSTPHPISTSLSVSSPRSSSSCRQILIPMTVSSPQSVPLPNPVSTPQPVSIPRPVSTPQPVTSPNPVSTPQPVSPSRPLSTPCPVSTHKPVPNPWPVLSPQPLQYPPPVTPIRITPDSLNSDRSDMTATPVRLTPHGGIALTPLKKLLQLEEADHEDCESVVNDVNIQSNSCNTINERSVEDDSIDEHDGGHNDDVDSDTEHSSEIVMNLDQVHEGQKMKFSIPGISQAVTVNFSVEALQEMKNAALKQTSCGNIPIETSDQYCEISSSNKIIKTNVASEVDPDTSTNKLLKRRKLKRNLRQKLKSNNKIAKSNPPESQETPNPIQYFCSLCNKTFLSHLQLEKHQKFHVRNCFCCELCQIHLERRWLKLFQKVPILQKPRL